MDKQQLLDLINDLPDDVFALPFEYSECKSQQGDWKSDGLFIGHYKTKVENELVIRLHFQTEYAGQFKRTYTDPDGSFYNVIRIL